MEGFRGLGGGERGAGEHGGGGAVLQIHGFASPGFGWRGDGGGDQLLTAEATGNRAAARTAPVHPARQRDPPQRLSVVSAGILKRFALVDAVEALAATVEVGGPRTPGGPAACSRNSGGAR